MIIQYVLLNTIEKIIIIPELNIFTDTKTYGSFQVCDQSFYNLLNEKQFRSWWHSSTAFSLDVTETTLT